MKKATNPHVTVTREGDRFSYKHQMDEKPTNSTMGGVIRVAHFIATAHGRTQSAMYFLSSSLRMLVEKGDLDESLAGGLADVLECVHLATLRDLDEYKVELGILEKLDSGEVMFAAV